LRSPVSAVILFAVALVVDLIEDPEDFDGLVGLIGYRTSFGEKALLVHPIVF